MVKPVAKKLSLLSNVCNKAGTIWYKVQICRPFGVIGQTSEVGQCVLPKQSTAHLWCTVWTGFTYFSRQYITADGNGVIYLVALQTDIAQHRSLQRTALKDSICSLAVQMWKVRLLAPVQHQPQCCLLCAHTSIITNGITLNQLDRCGAAAAAAQALM